MCCDSKGIQVQNADEHHTIHYYSKVPIHIEPGEGLIFLSVSRICENYALFTVIFSCSVSNGAYTKFSSVLLIGLYPHAALQTNKMRIILM